MVNRGIKKRSEDILAEILPLLKKTETILDLGSGTGHTAHELLKKGFKVTCVDYSDMNVFDDTKPIRYDGINLPFKDNSFDTVLLVTVLHHTPDPVRIIREASRVAKKIIIMEDTYNNIFQKYAVFVMDSIGNMEFVGHPHTNKTDRQWQKIFKKMGLKIKSKKKRMYWRIFESVTYLLEK
jgi:ubiquinone/menaquinone biosynthesis C-methylase UbiE